MTKWHGILLASPEPQSKRLIEGLNKEPTN